MIFIFAVCLAASIVGSICGIGGGVIIKPMLDAFGLADVATISFLSGCTVLAMTGYSVARSIGTARCPIDFRFATPLALGSALGGVIGKRLFSLLSGGLASPSLVGTVQSVALALVTLAALCYTLNKKRVVTRRLTGAIPSSAVGMGLGALSSFLGIGGGPINLPVLHYFFSMQTKAAVPNSLYTILFSQAASLGVTLLGGTVPPFAPAWLTVMVTAGLLGGAVGGAINHHLKESQVTRLFLGLMLVIVAISLGNAVRFSMR